MITLQETIKQRKDYTHQHNSGLGRHGWLRLTPAYSVKLVSDILRPIDKNKKVLDPFSGTATTVLAAGNENHSAASLDINPFLIWFGNAKIDYYTSENVDTARKIAADIVEGIYQEASVLEFAPPIHNIERWWSNDALTFLCSLKAVLETHLPNESKVKNLLLVAFCRVMMKVSNAAFNHQSMSFKSESNLFAGDFHMIFQEELATVLKSAIQNPVSQDLQVVQGDARQIHNSFIEKFDIVITSPPYPNRMSYIRELRPYMYWLGYLKEAREAGELDWQAIGGTWGIATSRLAEWQENEGTFYPSYLKKILENITNQKNKSSKLMSLYVAKYFEDTWIHLQSLFEVLSKDAELHYIVGNSSFYGTLLPVEQIYKDMFYELGVENLKISPIRKRNSKKELYEFLVSGIKR